MMLNHKLKRLSAVFCVGLLALSLSACEKEEGGTPTTETTYEVFEQKAADLPKVEIDENGEQKPVTLTFWYQDESAADYYAAAAAEFKNRYDIEVLFTYVDDINYLDAINKADVEGNGPDVFIASNDQIRKLQLAGLAEPNSLYTDSFWAENYPAVTGHAMSSDGKLYGYPIYMDTCVMLYDTALTGKPESFGDITNFAVEFVDETNTKDVFRFDMSDAFVDYMFLGADATVMGVDGEDTKDFCVNTQTVVDNMTYYQSLHDYFSMDANESSYQLIKQELTEGSLVYGIVRTDILSDLDSFPTRYEVCPIPTLANGNAVQPLSVTYGAFVSPYSKHAEYANLFAAFLSCAYAENVYGQTKYTPVYNKVEYRSEREQMAYQIYEGSISMPKALESGDFWLYMEICFKNIWNGSDVTEQLNQLQANMEARL